jgi:5-methylcytosine-specific restriction enzyme subunit McrC
MSKSINIIQVFEHQTLKVGTKEYPSFKEAHFNALEKYGYRTNEKYFYVGNKRIKFSNYVGVIQVRNLTIEILPKVDNRTENELTKEKWHSALVEMLRVCKLIKLNEVSNAKLKIKSASILDLYYDSFLTEVEKTYKQGLRKSYRTIDENLYKVKGKILFTRHIQKNLIHKERFYVEHKIFDADNKLNQILLKALLILKTIVHNSIHNIRINRLILDFEGVSECNVTEKWFERLKYDRNTERYKQAITLAKLIILKYSPDLKGGKENVLAIMFDMNTLFENYIYRKLKALQMKQDSLIDQVIEQKKESFWESNNLRADILVKVANNWFVIDTKWKALKSNTPSGTDLKQMFVYNLHYKAKHSILLYPKTSYETKEKKPFKHNDFNMFSCQVAFVDIFDNDNLEKELGLKIYNNLLKG